MKSKLILACSLLFATFSFSNAQKLQSGDIAPLKGEKVFNVKYEYENLVVGDKKEDVYISEKMADKDKKEPGTGEKWKTEWYGNRASKYQPKFEELMNNYFKEKGILAASDKPEAKYTIILKTKRMEPGFNVGVMRKPAAIDVVISIVETSSNKEIANLIMNDVPGRDAMGYDFDASYRISEAYAKCGKSVPKFIIKKLDL